MILSTLSAELKQAARMLFGARVGRLTDSEVFQEVQERQGRSELDAVAVGNRTNHTKANQALRCRRFCKCCKPARTRRRNY